ncbi:MAG: hypothetical protein HQK79_11300 [Desulfobacterales bacterium]|nr:hypothetical protein [Desulfobacterales bacterium]
MKKNKTKKPLTEGKVWILVCLVFLGLLAVLIIIANHEKTKPHSPQALVAAGLNQMFTIKEWQPGMGNKPFIYHPAGANMPNWQPLPDRPQNIQK